MPESSEIQGRNVQEFMLHLSQLRNAGTLTSYAVKVRKPPSKPYLFAIIKPEFNEAAPIPSFSLK